MAGEAYIARRKTYIADLQRKSISLCVGHIPMPNTLMGCFFNTVGDGFLPHISLQPGAVAPNGFPRGEAVAKIGSSEPILVTDEESGRKTN